MKPARAFFLIVEAPDEQQFEEVGSDAIVCSTRLDPLPQKGEKLVLNPGSDDSDILGTVEEVARYAWRNSGDVDWAVWVKLERAADFANLNQYDEWKSDDDDTYSRRSTSPSVQPQEAEPAPGTTA